VPEQVWEDPDLPAAPYGADPTTASIGFTDGAPAGSAAPLTWAQAQELRLIVDLGSGRTVDRPALTTARYVDRPAPAAVPVTITSPTDGSTIEGATTTVTGTTTPGAAVDIGYADTDTGSAAGTVSTRADATGAFTAQVAVGLGANALTVAATTGSGGTGYAQTTVVGDFIGGTTVLDTTDPTGDDNGPGTYRYPTDPAFVPGSFDLTRFQVITSDGTVYLRTTLKSLVPTFGNTMGAQLLDIYVHDPAASATSTAAAFPSRGYTIAPADAWSQRLEVQGFAAPVWDDPAGTQLGTPTAVASAAAHTITIALPQAEFGTPGAGWTFTVALTGQEGSAADQARSFAPTAQQYAFGICPAGGTQPICAADPGSVPEVMDTIAPPGVPAGTELDPTLGPVVLRGITVP
jgi:glucoamylase